MLGVHCPCTMVLALDDGLEDAHDGLCGDTHVEEIERGWMDG
jgi:hypothetical protein